MNRDPQSTNPEILTPERSLEIVQERLVEFFSNPGFDTLAAGYDDIHELPQDDLQARANVLVTRLAPRLDYRGAAERFHMDWRQLSEAMPYELRIIAIQAAIELGMTAAKKAEKTNPTYALALGAGRMGPFYRVEYAYEQFPDAERLVYAGSHRLTTQDELRTAQRYVPQPPGARTEFDLGVRAFESILQGRITQAGKTSRTGGGEYSWAYMDWADRRVPVEGSPYDTPDWIIVDAEGHRHLRQPIPKTAIAVSTPEVILDEQGKQRRATTYDALAAFADWVRLIPGQTVGIATAALYGNAAELHALRALTLESGVSVEVARYDAQYSEADWQPAQLLQEIGESILAGAKLWRAIYDEKVRQADQEQSKWLL